ncbi:MAG: sugar ABC transporter permease [Chloroflexi bacterium]|nr:sugar ABC transporter permease [Chloroflexota bacterium]
MTALEVTEKEKGKYAAFFQSLRNIRHEGWGSVEGYLFILPLVAMWLLFSGYPYIRGILIAFQDYRMFKPETWPVLSSWSGLTNFVKMFQDKAVIQGIKASFNMWAWTVPFTFALALFSAVLLNRVKNPKLASLYRVLITLAWVIPEAAAMPMWTYMLDANVGYLNYFLRDVLKIWANPPAWTSDFFWYWIAIAMASIWKGFGWNMLLFLLGLYNIPSELYDAAKIDGANGVQTLLHVELPGIRNIMLLYLVTNVGWVGGGLVNVWTFGTGPQNIGRTLSLYAWQVSFQGTARMGYGAAMNFFAGVCNLILAALVVRLFPTEKA